jgi:lysophospholipase L1-like esterase
MPRFRTQCALVLQRELSLVSGTCVRRVAKRLCSFATAGAMIISSQATGATTVPRFNPPKTYYLALGDSLAYGFQLSKAMAGLPPSSFDSGYVDRVATRLREIQPSITTVNYGCPGETTGSFISGPCLWTESGHLLHDTFSGSQLNAAIAFLRAHPGEVSPITVTLWGNDVREFVISCSFDIPCLQNRAPDFISRVSANLATILSQLRAAAPNAEIIVTGAWDSFIEDLVVADPLLQALNASMAAVARSQRAFFADPFPIFNPQGDLEAEIQAICTLLLLCSAGDSHPSDLGYSALGDLVFDVSGYSRLLAQTNQPTYSHTACTCGFIANESADYC